MNYLAHAWLAGTNDSTVFGAVIADHIKGRLSDNLSTHVRVGICHHRRLDSFVDEHPSTLQFLADLKGLRRRYGGILLDMLYDHLLATQWHEYTTEPSVQTFADNTYQVLQHHRFDWPTRFELTGDRMIRNNWLGRYAEIEVMKVAIKNVGERVRGGEALVAIATELEAYLGPAQTALDQLWPDLSRYADQLLEELPAAVDGEGRD